MLVSKPKNQKKIIKQKLKRKKNKNINYKVYKKKYNNFNYSLLINILIYSFIIFSLFYIINAVYDFVLNKDYFILRDKKVENLKYLPKNSFYSIIDEYFELNYDDVNRINLFRINLKEIENYILNSSDRIKNVDVNMIFPSTLNFFVEERLPFLTIMHDDKIYYLDKEFYIFNILENEQIDYIVLSGLDNTIVDNKLIFNDTSTIISFIDILSKDEINMISEIHFESDNNIELYMNDLNFKIKLGGNNIIKRYERVKNFVLNISDDDIEYIDARFDKPIISFRKR